MAGDIGCFALLTRNQAVKSGMTIQTTLPDPAQLASTPRARGCVRLSVKGTPRGTAIDGLHQAGSAKVVFPRARTGLQAVTVNTAGGITGGDRFEYAFAASEDTHLTITTQAAERAYGAQSSQTGRLDSTLTVAEGARLDWLPQETILFDRSRFARKMQIELAPSARLLFVEPLVFGRAAMGEGCTDIEFLDRIDIHRDGGPLFVDAVTLRGNVTDQMKVLAQGAGALASLVYVAPDAAAHLDPIRAILPVTAGASVIGEDLLHVRFLAPDSFDLRAALIPVLDRLTQNSLPRAWMI